MDDLNAAHMTAMELLIAGHTQKAAAEAVGVTQVCVSHWLRQPAFVQKLEEIREVVVRQTQAIIVNESVRSVNRIREIRDYGETDRVKLEAAKDLLDRAGFKAIERTEAIVQHDIGPELAEVLREINREARVVEGVRFEETHQLPERVRGE